MSRMCTDPSVYELDAFWKSKGLAGEDEVRHEVLWLAARRGEVPIHTGKCPYCSDLLASFDRMQAVLGAEGPVVVAVCPGAEEFTDFFYGKKDPAIEAHIKVCSACREDLAFLSRSQEPRDKVAPLKRRMKWMLVAAAALIFTLVASVLTKKPDKFPPHSYAKSSQYASLAQTPPVDREKLLAMSPRDRHSRLDQVLAAYNKGDYKDAERIADIVYRTVDDPAAAYLLGMAQFQQGKLPQALESMRASEKDLAAPNPDYRCWGALQIALMLGDKATIQRELSHVESEPEYHGRCAQIRERFKG